MSAAAHAVFDGVRYRDAEDTADDLGECELVFAWRQVVNGRVAEHTFSFAVPRAWLPDVLPNTRALPQYRGAELLPVCLRWVERYDATHPRPFGLGLRFAVEPIDGDLVLMQVVNP